MKMKKRGVIEVGFSWIFILIAGAVILGLFAYIGYSQESFFSGLIKANLLNDLNAIFIGATVSKNTAALFEIPNSRLGFDCDSYGIDGITHPLQGHFVFGPEELETDELITWSKPWGLGFRVTNFLYISSPYVKYYVVYKSSESSLANEIYNDLPSQLKKELLEINGAESIENQNYDRIVVLVVGEDNYQGDLPSTLYKKSEFSNYGKEEVIFVYLIKETGGSFDLTDTTLTGRIMFKDRDLKKMSYDDGGYGPYEQTIYDLSSVYAAFISGNQEVWQCMMQKAFFKARHVTKIYDERTEKLSLNSPYAVCQSYYSLALDNTDGYFKKMSDNLDDPGTGNIDVPGLKSDILEFDQLNTNLERASCPLIY